MNAHASVLTPTGRGAIATIRVWGAGALPAVERWFPFSNDVIGTVEFFRVIPAAALFLDIDFLALGDVAELFALNDERYAAMVSKNPKKFEWASMIMFNCGHPANRILTPDFVDDAKALGLLSIALDDAGRRVDFPAVNLAEGLAVLAVE